MPTSPTRLAHLHLPHPISYTHSLRLQEAILNRHWVYRDALKSNTPPSKPLHPPPPTLLTFSTHPAYTVGRRHLTLNPLSASQIAFLTGAGTESTTPPSSRATLQSSFQNHLPPDPEDYLEADAEAEIEDTRQAASFHASPRGGLLTYHSPGQLTAYPIIDLRRFGLSARQYISLLENVVISTCTKLGVPNVGRRCGDPGVWMLSNTKDASDAVGDRKICAIGVQVTRGTTSHGIGLNVTDAPIPANLRSLYRFQDPDGNELEYAGKAEDDRGYLSWGFGRIVACGLEGRGVTWLSKEGAKQGVGVEDVATVFAKELLRALNEASKEKGSERLEGVQAWNEADILQSEEGKGP